MAEKRYPQCLYKKKGIFCLFSEGNLDFFVIFCYTSLFEVLPQAMLRSFPNCPLKAKEAPMFQMLFLSLLSFANAADQEVHVRNTALSGRQLGMLFWHPKDGCPSLQTSGGQFMAPRQAAIMVNAAAQSRATCVVAVAEAEAKRTRAETEKTRVEAEAAAQLIMASAAATAAENGGAIYSNVRDGTTATSTAAPIAAMGGGQYPVYPGAPAYAAYAAINGGSSVVLAPPDMTTTRSGRKATETSKPTSASSSSSTPTSSVPTTAERVKEAQAEAAAALAAAQGK